MFISSTQYHNIHIARIITTQTHFQASSQLHSCYFANIAHTHTHITVSVLLYITETAFTHHFMGQTSHYKQRRPIHLSLVYTVVCKHIFLAITVVCILFKIIANSLFSLTWIFRLVTVSSNPSAGILPAHENIRTTQTSFLCLRTTIWCYPPLSTIH